MSVKPEPSDDQHYDSPESGANGAVDDGAWAPAGAPPESEVERLQALADENWDRYVRTAAELENVRKRAARDMDNARKFALERFATELLAVRDSIEMGCDAPDGMGAADILAGNKVTLKQFAATLERFGVQEVDPAGEPFDPTFHEAMTVQPSREVEPNTVLTVLQKGYTLNGRLLRPARVIVAAAPGAV